MNEVAIQAEPAPTQKQVQDDERAWIERARNGDRKAFEQLYCANVDRIYGLCIRLCAGNPTLAMEMTQDAFIRAWSRMKQFRGDSLFSTWMHRLTVNLVLGERRKQLRRAEMLNDVFQEDQAVRENPGQGMDLEAAVSKLPERARNVLILHDIEGYRHREIGEVLGMAIGTSKVQLHRARKLLRQMLTPEQ